MKKILLLALVALLSIISIVGCNNSNVKSYKTQAETEVKEEANEPTQEEFDNKLKQEAIKANFVELNGKADSKRGLRVFAEGKVSAVSYDKTTELFSSFTLSQKENSGFGMYNITNILDIKGLEEGDTVKIYGTVDGEDESGLPKITATIIEKIQ